MLFGNKRRIKFCTVPKTTTDIIIRAVTHQRMIPSCDSPFVIFCKIEIDKSRSGSYNGSIEIFQLIFGCETMELTNKQMTVIFKAFCDENRIQILKLLQGGERCACELLEELSLSQPTLSHHMKILCDSGVVDGRKVGKWMYYTISAEGAELARSCIAEITSLSGQDLSINRKCNCDE